MEKIDALENLINPKVLKSRLIFMALFITAYEQLKYSVVERIKHFFTNGFEDDKWLVSPRYKDELNSTGGKKPLHQSLLWLKNSNVINDSDIANFYEIKKYRNKFAHELAEAASSFDQEKESELFQKTTALIRKIDVWWIMNVDLAIDPDYSDKEISEEDISPGSLLVLQMMTEVALNEGEDAEAYMREYEKRK